MKLRIALLTAALLAPQAPAKPVPALKFTDPTGTSHRLTDLRGAITVVSFWATWCAPCLDELPRLNQLSQQYASRGVHFVLISADSTATQPKVEPFLQQHSIALTTWLGADSDTLDRLNLGNELPATLILDATGEPIARIEGEARDPDLTTPLDWLLANRAGPAPSPVIKRYERTSSGISVRPEPTGAWVHGEIGVPSTVALCENGRGVQSPYNHLLPRAPKITS